MPRMQLLEEASGTQFEGFALVKNVAVRQNVKGADYLDLVLADAGGEAAAKLWDYKKEEHGVLDPGDIVKVRGQITLWKDAEQLKIDKIRFAAPGEAEMEKLVPCAPIDPQAAYAALVKLVSEFQNDELRQIVQHLLSKNREKLLYFPAAVKLHHATRGGLLHHTLSIVKLAKAVCAAYPALNAELVYAGSILHDIGKLGELDANELGLAGAYTAEGSLIGHINMGVTAVNEAAHEVGASKETAMLLSHMLLSHHGVPDFGSPKYPMFPEAEVLSELDLLDSRLYEMFYALDSVQDGAFSERQWALDNRQLYKIPKDWPKA